jgi:hypothetical protein
MFAKAFTIASLASFASAHMVMTNPKPYGSPNNSPLDASGSDFPCKGAVNDGASTNTYKTGSTQQLSFMGSAVHGGGSCQVSLTTDKNPTKDSVWKVIHSIEGGCPAKNQAGNYPENASADNPDKYDFKIPEELAAGDYVLAWTWFNHVGNREMYMNCAAVKVEGQGGSEGYLDSLPDMFVANVGNKCATQPNSDLKFPNPGNSVSQLKSKLLDPEGPGCQKPGGGSNGGSDGGAGGNPEPSAPAADPTSDTGAQPTEPATTPAPGAGSGSGDGSNGAPEIPGGAFITVSQPAASQPSATQTPEASAAPETPGNGSDNGSGPDAGSGSGSGNNGGDSGSGSGGFAAGTACTTEGEWNCIGGSSFQRCASGAWTPSQGLSSGVTCTPGQGADISMTVKRGARKMRRSQRHNA